MDEEKLNRLPPDVKKQFIKYAIKLSERKKQTVVNKDFLSFVKHVWPEFIEGPHHKKIAKNLTTLQKVKLKD